jgi:antitoxin HicB
VHLEAVLECHQDPALLNEMLLHRLTVEAKRAVEASGLSERELARPLGTSPTQLHRLLDPTYRGKSMDQMAVRLRVVGKDVELVVRDRAKTPVHPSP